MNLAAILLFGIFFVSSVLPLAARPQTAPTNQPAGSAAPTPSSTPQTPSAAAPGASSDQKQSPTKKRRRHKKRVIKSNCASAPAAAGPAAGDSTAGTGAPANCPPSKVIVRQGGTAEPSIELAGSANSNQTSNQRDTANQMLRTTEANLKKIAGQQLSSNQQDMVTQIRQFVAQSKAAVADGDLDRARTLAWKAQVLSEELVKPAK